jgi:hypothetical protein
VLIEALSPSKLRNVEIDAAFLFADGRAGDRVGADDGEQVAGGVHAHQLVAAVPVDMQRQLLADFRHRLVGSGNVDDLVLGLAADRCGDLDLRPVGAFEKAGIARLAAGGGIEAGLVEDDAAAIVDRDHGALGDREIGIVAKQRLDRICHQSGLLEGHVDLGPCLHPFRRRQVLFAQEGRIEQLRLVAVAVVAEHGHDGVAGAHLLRHAGSRRRC